MLGLKNKKKDQLSPDTVSSKNKGEDNQPIIERDHIRDQQNVK